MRTRDALALRLRSLDKKTYYDVLGVARDASADAVKRAFHAFSLQYHPDQFVAAEDGSREIAAEVFKRGVEAYGCLSRPPQRERYDRALARGKVRLEPWLPSTRPPPPPQRTLEAIARTPAAKKFAAKAERLIDAGRLAEARIALVDACQRDPGNDELAERLALIYEALALEPP